MHGKVMPSRLVYERSRVVDTSAHLPFPPAGTRRYLLAAIDMTVLSAAVLVRPCRGSGPEQPADGLGEPIRLGWSPRALGVDHRFWLVGEQRAGHLPDVVQAVGTGEQRAVTKQHVVWLRAAPAAAPLMPLSLAQAQRLHADQAGQVPRAGGP